MKRAISFLLASTILFASARDHQRVNAEAASAPVVDFPEVNPDDFDQLWFENPIDHFNYQDTRTYKQRFWQNDKYFDEEKGIVFLYICGEYTCSIRPDRLYPFMVGAQKGAKLLALEHRYYGKSQPFDNWDTENLRYLDSE